MSKFSSKADAHGYIVDMESIKDHKELYKFPHLRSFYSSSFKQVMREAQTFCAEISNLRLNEVVSQYESQGRDAKKALRDY